MDTCGSDSVVPRWPLEGTDSYSVEIDTMGPLQNRPASLKCDEIRCDDVLVDSSLSRSWGSVEVTAAGGTYRLCWCGANMRCKNANEFRHDIGPLTLVDPEVGREVGTVL